MTGDLRDRAQAVRAALIDPIDVATRLGLTTGERTGRSVKVSCVWHDEDTPSCNLRVNGDRLAAKCFGCGSGGDVLDLIAAVRGLDTKGKDFGALVEAGEQLAGIASPRPVRIAPPDVAAFAASRGVRLETLRAFGVTAIVDSRQGQHRPALRYPSDIPGANRIKFLDGCRDEAGRKLRKYTWDEAGTGRLHWYNLARATKLLASSTSEVLYVVNGEPAVWAATEAKVAAVCLCGGESSLPTEAMVLELQTAISDAAFAPSVHVVYDHDHAGKNGAPKVAATLRAQIKRAEARAIAAGFPDGAEKGADVGDLYQRVGDRLGEVLAALPPLEDPQHADDGTVDISTVELPEHPPNGRSVGRLLSDVEFEELEWLWRDRIPVRKLCFLDGDPCLGKTTLAIDIAAKVTSGAAFPGDEETREPAGVVFCTVEDGLGDTIRPRFEAAGGDASRVLVFDLDDVPSFDEVGLATIEAAIAQVGAKLVVIDPLMGFLPDATNVYNDHHIRRVLKPVAALADRAGAALLVIRHHTKGGGNNSKFRGGGSIGITGAARAGIMVAADPSSEDGRCILANVKENLSGKAPALAYTIRMAETGRVGRDGTAVRMPCIEWLGETEHRADDLLAAAGTDEETQSAIEEAIDFIRVALAQGPMATTELEQLAKREGISGRTLRRARRRMGLVKARDGFQGRVTWALPASIGVPNRNLAKYGKSSAEDATESVAFPGASEAGSILGQPPPAKSILGHAASVGEL